MKDIDPLFLVEPLQKFKKKYVLHFTWEAGEVSAMVETWHMEI